MALLTADPEKPGCHAVYIDRPKHLRVFDQSARWCSILGAQNAPDIHRMLETKQFRAFIRVNEALHDKAIADIADTIARKGSQLILVAGPSSSGKTTFTGRLAIHLRVLGLQPVMISLDDYYINRAELPREADGSVDLEALRRRHPEFLFVGHYDKMVMPHGEAAMRAEFERLLPVMRQGGFVPSVDHQTPPGVSLENYRCYLKLLSEYALRAVKD